jgi:hypothetical protein
VVRFPTDGYARDAPLRPSSLKMTRNELTIRLAESVVFVRTADRTINSSPSMVRGLLTLDLVKPTKISSIKLEFQGTSSITVPLNVPGPDEEQHKIVFSASTVFFSATSGSASRRTSSVGPAFLHNNENAHGDGWEEFKKGANVPHLFPIWIE